MTTARSQCLVPRAWVTALGRQAYPEPATTEPRIVRVSAGLIAKRLPTLTQGRVRTWKETMNEGVGLVAGPARQNPAVGRSVECYPFKSTTCPLNPDPLCGPLRGHHGVRDGVQPLL
jgi:hypothetical protein